LRRSPAIPFVLLFFGCAVVARAHGIGTPQVLNAVSGPYLISVWTDPDPLRADETHVVVAVTDPKTREPILAGVVVTVVMQLMDDPAVRVSQTAGADGTNQLLFAAEFNNRVTAGRWQGSVSVEGERGSGKEVVFEVDVSPARGFNWLWVGIGGLAILVLVWAFFSIRSAPPTGRPQRRDRSVL
jgi:hypothetical protein